MAAASDEFYFFPQAGPDPSAGAVWDDFSEEAVERFAGCCLSWESRLAAALPAASGPDAVDLRCLAGAVRTLREQLAAVGPQRSQPTFHLTVAAAGLAGALQSEEPDAFRKRCGGLPEFLSRAASILTEVPALFLASGSAMARDLGSWLEAAEGGGAAAAAVREFGRRLGAMRGDGSFVLPAGQFELLLESHYGAGMGTSGVRAVLEEEIREMEDVLGGEAARLGFRSRKDATRSVPRASLPAGGPVVLYREEAGAMRRHCLGGGLELETGVLAAPLRVDRVPAFLEAVRASDAYQALPGSPPRGGVFFVRRRGAGAKARTIEYRMTCAHETWPGHHLLDACRWAAVRPLRRPLELPLYYEGWACFAEELMAATGYLVGEWDRFLLALRRLKRAVRGIVDVGLQTGDLDPREAAALLVDAGFAETDAAAVIPKFALRPGYQVCYTLGLRRFLDLPEGLFSGAPWSRAGEILAEGEIGFDELERVLTRGGRRT